jgi:hypothetical protein
MYPIQPNDVRNARRGIVVLGLSSVLWYLSLIGLLLFFTDTIMNKIHGKFVDLADTGQSKLPLLALLAALAGTGALRLLGYKLCQVVAGALAVPESISLGLAGAAIYICAVGTIYFGFTGLLALVAVFGAAVELRFLRFPATLFSLVVSPEAVKKVHWYFYARTAWFCLVVPAGLIILLAHILIDIPRNEGGPFEKTILLLNSILYVVFKILAFLAIGTLPIVVVGYYAVLYTAHRYLERILDPNGPRVQLAPPEKPGFSQLKEVLQPQDW